jgi:hypothetical protein
MLTNFHPPHFSNCSDSLIINYIPAEISLEVKIYDHRDKCANKSRIEETYN